MNRNGLWILDLTRFLNANRFSPRIKSGAGFRSKTLWLLLIVAERVGQLVVVLGDEIDIALVLDRRRRRLQRVVEIGQRFLLVLGRHLLVGLDLGDLRLDDGLRADIFLGCWIEAAEHQADIVN